MPFDSGTVTFRICTLNGQMPEDALEKFAQYSAPPVEKIKAEPVWGWVSPRHLLETRIDDSTCRYGAYYHLCLRQAQRKIPASLLNAECKMEELTRLAATGNEHLSKKERKAIKQEVTERLLPQMPPQFSGIYVCIDPQENLLYTTATSDKQLELVITNFHQALGFEPIPLTPDSLALSKFEVDPAMIPHLNISPERNDATDDSLLGENFLTWLWFYQEEHEGILPPSKLGDFQMLIDGPLVLMAEGSGAFETHIQKGAPTISAEAKAALTVGKKLRRAKIVLARGKNEEWSFTFDANGMIFKGAKIPEGESMDPYSMFEERMNNLYIMHCVIFALFGKFLGEMTDDAKAADYQSKARKWIQEREGK